MAYPVISVDFARRGRVDGERAIYMGAVIRHPEYAQWENQTVTLRDEGEVDAEARLVRQPIGDDDQWYGVLLSPIRDISVHGVFADFAEMKDWPGVGNAIPLGAVASRPDLAREKEQLVLLTDYNSLQAWGRVVQHDGWWYGVPTSEREDIHPDAQAS
jgi:hypothetical protein